MILSDALILPVPVSHLQTQQVTNYVTHRILNTDLLYSCAQFVVENYEKSSHNGEFQYDLMMIRYGGLLVWATLYTE